MNIAKIGKLLQTLRKEKGITQEQLAEQVGVTRRTVSRWETGSNMPDLDVLIELSDFYAVDLRKILSGERNDEYMNEEVKETVLCVVAYSNEEKRRLLQRIHWIFIIGLMGIVAFLMIVLLKLETTAPYEMMGSFGLGLGFGTLFLGAIFTGRNVTKIRNLKMKMKKEVKKANERDA